MNFVDVRLSSFKSKGVLLLLLVVVLLGCDGKIGPGIDRFVVLVWSCLGECCCCSFKFI